GTSWPSILRERFGLTLVSAACLFVPLFAGHRVATYAVGFWWPCRIAALALPWSGIGCSARVERRRSSTRSTNTSTDTADCAAICFIVHSHCRVRLDGEWTQ